VSWFVQVKYPAQVPAQAADGWVTVAVSEDMREAARHAAFVYRVREHPDDSYPDQLRIRSEQQLHAALARSSPRLRVSARSAS
jgi:hypothetical protein